MIISRVLSATYEHTHVRLDNGCLDQMLVDLLSEVYKPTKLHCRPMSPKAQGHFALYSRALE